MTNNPFTEQEIESYMQTAFKYVDANYPVARNQDWEQKVRESLRLQYAKGAETRSHSHDAELFSELVWDGYYFNE